MVAGSTSPNGGFFERPHARRCLAGIDNALTCAVHRGDILGGHRCDAAQSLDEVERNSFAEKDGTGVASHARDIGSRDDRSSILDQCREFERAVDPFKHGSGHVESEDHTIGLDEHCGRGFSIGRDGAVGGDIPRSDVFG